MVEKDERTAKGDAIEEGADQADAGRMATGDDMSPAEAVELDRREGGFGVRERRQD